VGRPVLERRTVEDVDRTTTCPCGRGDQRQREVGVQRVENATTTAPGDRRAGSQRAVVVSCPSLREEASMMR